VKEGASVAVMASKAATPWGPAEIVEELTVPQRAGDQRFTTIVQLLRDKKGEEFVRFAYSTDGRTRRGPVTLRERDLERFRAAVSEHPAIAAALGL
jgi:hypothetical protein